MLREMDSHARSTRQWGIVQPIVGSMVITVEARSDQE
jgi:hypothetical protein